MGIPDEAPYVPDPHGFEPAAPAQNVAGRSIRPITTRELMLQHQAVAGEHVSILGTTKPSLDIKSREEKIREEEREAWKPPPVERPQETSGDRAERIMPEFLQPAPQPQESPPPSGGPPAAPPGGGSGSGGGSGKGGWGSGEEQNALLRDILREAERAREDGDPALAARIRGLAESSLGGSNMSRKISTPKRSPVLERLRSNLGLRKIQPASVEWGGMKWHFTSTPAPLDYWMYAQLPDDPIGRGLHSAALGISAALVGIDEEPLWKVLNIPLTTVYEIDVPDPTTGGTAKDQIKLNLHAKRCPTCSLEVDLEDKKCGTCGAAVDPYDVPLSLRFRYADTFFEWLQNELGPYEQLDELWTLMREAVKSRSLDQEDLYPLLNWSQQQTETPTSPSGAE